MQEHTYKTLIEQVLLQTGDREGDFEFAPLDKLCGVRGGHGNVLLGPGDRLRIYWKSDDARADFYDIGIIFTLPGIEGNDCFMAGVVQVPNPTNWGGKDSIPPLWLTLDELLKNEHVWKVETLRAG